jgi:L-asparaginase II
MNAVPLAELWRGGRLESAHLGHAVIMDGAGQIVQAWGDAGLTIYPRSACKMIQALPLVESGAADRAGLTSSQLALSCASHQGAALHRQAVADWLAGLGLGEGHLRCGAHEPYDVAERNRLIKTDESPCQYHNNCSGKHAGFVTLNRHLGGGSEYIEPDHPVQKAVREAFEDVTGEESPGFGIDGCSAPNFATSLAGLARSMAFFAAAREDAGSAREKAAFRLTRAMAEHPMMVAGEGRACTELMQATGGKVSIKTGAEGVFTAILPEQGLGIALKVVDGASRASEAAIAALLVKLGVLDKTHPAAQKRLNAVQRNCRGIEAAFVQPAASFPG